MAHIPGAESATSADSVRATARAGSPDRYLSALLAPPVVRDDLIALAAFSAEIEKIPRLVSDPHLGEIRVQWWRDTLRSGDPSGHPVADAFMTTMRRHDLPLGEISGHLDATVHGLYGDPPADGTQLSLAIDLDQGVLFTLAARILGAKDVAGSRGIIYEAAQAYGLVRLGLSLPYDLARGRSPLPASMLASETAAGGREAIKQLASKARSHLTHVRTAYPAEPAAIKTALLPIALVEPYLRALTKQAHDPVQDIADIAPLTRAWRLAKTHFSGRF